MQPAKITREAHRLPGDPALATAFGPRFDVCERMTGREMVQDPAMSLPTGSTRSAKSRSTANDNDALGHAALVLFGLGIMGLFLSIAVWSSPWLNAETLAMGSLAISILGAILGACACDTATGNLTTILGYLLLAAVFLLFALPASAGLLATEHSGKAAVETSSQWNVGEPKGSRAELD